MKRAWLVAGLVSVSWGLLACEETTPTSGNGTLIPLALQTVQLDLSFEEFAEAVTTYGGYGAPSELLEAVLAQDYEGVLDARVLVKYSEYPFAASVRDSTGTTRADSAFAFVGGRLVVRFDTTGANRPDGAVTVSAGALPQEFDPQTASWLVAVDTLGDLRPWGEAGAGPALALGQAEWDPATGDSIVLELDSATVAQLGDTLQAGPGVRYEVLTPGVRMNLLSSDLRLYARPNIHLDTLVTLNARPIAETFIYDPSPEPEQGGIRVGGAPSWRTVLTFDVPAELPGTPAVCQRVQCPIVITPGRLNNATLTLTTAQSEAAFQPSDSLFVDARAVLAPELLPKSPLGTSLVGNPGVPIGPDGFGEVAGQTITIPVTTFVRALFDGSGEKVPDLALLTPLEPLSIGFGTFVGPGLPGAPRLRLILTVADTVEIS